MRLRLLYYLDNITSTANVSRFPISLLSPFTFFFFDRGQGKRKGWLEGRWLMDGIGIFRGSSEGDVSGGDRAGECGE
jgi:hypothetical protein